MILVSVNRENVTWQSEDGTWRNGHWTFYYTDQDSEDFDPEWDVEYGTEFHWVSRPAPDHEAAFASWDGANPGGTTVLDWATNEAYCRRLDEKAAALLARGR
jgi:hypothetical protein